ncbi:MAG: DNA polymerase [Candidatus Diapherotrites archaeon CG11_big_fil_rev_8_21_14_0_20_37_9]|nr:MAG: DNA polymerase [Candidatus Diapherotrites archaeon CG11_big_fil_rev_8_21_14_0_20_37_9]
MSTNKLYGTLLDVDYTNDQEQNSIIQLYISTKNGIKSIKDSKYKPYFYIISGDLKATVKALKDFDFGENQKAISVEPVEKKNVSGVIKVSFKNPQDLIRARDLVKDLPEVLDKREFDIRFSLRYLIDKGLKPMQPVEVEEENGELKSIHFTDDKPEYNMVSIDLETYSPGRFSTADKDPILMIVLSSKKGSKVYTYKKSAMKEAVILKDEKEMIEKVLADIRTMNTEILVTYNGDSFDLPYLKTRCEKLKISCDFGFGGVKITKKGIFNAASLTGIQHLDAFQLLKFMARIGAVSLLKFDLENVSDKLFNKPKEKVAASEINRAWDSGKIDHVIKYNREDGEITLELAEEFLPMQVALCAMLQQNLFETSRATSSQMVERLLMIKAFEKNHLVPNKPLESDITDREETTFKGGFVKEPLPGLHENIAVLDFRSLHPSIMIAHNISPETLKCNHQKCKTGKNLSPDGDWFCMEKKGFLSGILEDILAKRIEIKKQLKEIDKKSHEYSVLNARQHALKILLNSHYGYLGYPRSRWYSRESAGAVTAWSRKYINFVNDEAEKKGYISLYSDTDSSFLILPKEIGEKEARAFAAEINEKLPGAMELEFEGLFKRGIFVTKKEGGAAKKKYALVDFEGNLKIVGFEYVRRDWSAVAKNTQKKVLETVLIEGDAKKAAAIARETIKKLKEGKTPKKDLVIMTMLKRKIENYDSIGPHVAAAKKAIERGKDVGPGTILGFVITKTGKSISEKAELEEYVAEGNYDANYYIENQIIPAVIKILRELGYSEDDLKEGGKQSSLFSFG